MDQDRQDPAGRSNPVPGEFTPAQGRILAGLARATIARELECGVAPSLEATLEAACADPAFQQRRGTFVTLTQDGQLRGCIGTLEPREAVWESVRQNAVNAAFRDRRFPPLKPSELEITAVEISILTTPQPLEYEDAADLLHRLRPHRDGVILRKGIAAATFLPQVWQQLPEPERFVRQLCMKAGLPPDDWKTGGLEIQTYTVQHFTEND